MPTLKIGLGQWFGEYRGITRQWLRWYDVEGTGFPRMQSSGAGASAARFGSTAARFSSAAARFEQQAERLAELRAMG